MSEAKIEKQYIAFCKSLPVFVTDWRLTLEQAKDPAQHLLNLTEQLTHVSKANLQHTMTNFVYVQKTLQHQISIQIEEAMGHLKDLLEKLNNTNYTFNNKLSQLEANTNANYLSLDDEDSDLVRGSGTVPRLDALLQASLAFATFFSQSLRTINDNFKRLNIKDERTLRRFQQSLCLDFNDKIVTYLLALTQYVDNEAAVI